MSEICPHCNHSWERHRTPGCEECGCKWTYQDVYPPPPPPPPTPEELRIEKVCTAIFDELDGVRELELTRNVKKAPKPAERNKISVGGARVNWGPQTYGRPNIVASAPVECIDDLVAAVLEAQSAIHLAQQGKPQ